METEARLIELARGAGAPAPAVVHVCQPDEGLGRGYVMERIAGETIARRILRDAAYAEARAEAGAAARRSRRPHPRGRRRRCRRTCAK